MARLNRAGRGRRHLSPVDVLACRKPGPTATDLGKTGPCSLDGIPESVATGVSLLGGGSVATPVVVAVFLSNVPESLSAARGLTIAGHSRRYVLGLWTAVAIMSAMAAAFGYAVLGGASPSLIAAIQAFAAGAILTMLADTMMPEAFEHGGSVVGLVTVLGFSLAFLLSTLE